MHKIIKIEGMSCGHCAERIQKLLNAMDGVSAKVYLEEAAADVEIAGDVSDNALKDVVENAGFQVVSIS